jgi:hypothetical protein
MKRFVWICAVGLAVVAMSTVANAAEMVAISGAVAQEGTGGNVFKTPPMADSDTLSISWGIHFYGAAPSHWAGVLFKSHVLDGSEVSLTGVTSAPGALPPAPWPTPPSGAAGQSVSVSGWWWNTAAPLSGFTPPTSTVVGPVVTWTIHAMNTTPANNSDVDMSLMFWNIFHIPAGTGSDNVLLQPSDYVWAPGDFVPQPGQPFPSFPLPFDDPGGRWVHIDFPTSWHIPAGEGSWYYAQADGTSFLGIEHVPEPATGLLLIGGAGALFASRRARKRQAA